MNSEAAGNDTPGANYWIYKVSLDASSEDVTNEVQKNKVDQPAIESIKNDDNTTNTEVASNEHVSNTSSKSSIKSKKSGNILTQFMTRSRKKKLMENYSEIKMQLVCKKEEEADKFKQLSCTSLSVGETINDHTSKVYKVESKSRIPVPKHKSDMAKDKIQSKHEISNITTVSNTNTKSKNEVDGQQSANNIQSIQSVEKELESPVSKTKNQSFLRKMLNKQTASKTASVTNKKTCTECVDNFHDGEVYLRQVTINESSSTKVQQEHSASNETVGNDSLTYDTDSKASILCGNFMASKYINFSSPSLDLSLSEALHQVMDLSTKLKEDGEHVTQILKKYVQDTSFQKELLDAVFQHSKLQLETERRVQSLSNELWLQQADISRNQERIVQDTLNSIINQNRQLQEDNENLTRKNEQLVSKLASLSYLNPRVAFGSNNQLIEKLTKSNDKLQYKVALSVKRIEQLEEELQKIQKSNNFLEERTRNLNLQIQSYKGLLQRANADHELEIAILSQKLHSNEVIIQNSVEAGDVLIEDLDALKRQAKSLPCTLNWTKLKCRGNSLTDLIHMGRSCINEFARELISLQAKISLNEKDNEVLRAKNKALEENLVTCTTEMNKMAALIENYQKREAEREELKRRNEQLSEDMEKYVAKVSELQQVFKQNEQTLSRAMDDIESFNEKIHEKEKHIDNVTHTVELCKSENSKLKQQIEELNEVINSSGAGDMAQMLTETYDKLSYFEEQYYKLSFENASLAQQVSLFDAEKQTFVEYQDKYNQHLNLQQSSLETLAAENTALKEELDRKHASVTALQNEKLRYQEERNILRSIYQQLKKEVSRVETLEGTVANVNKEANRLAIIAEYNKQLGEKLKNEVEIREQAIAELQNSVSILNSAHVENTKDKIALCVELSEVCTVKNQLSGYLDAEMQKNSTLGQSKKEYENAINTRLKAVEEMQKTERAAMRELLEEYKNVLSQRDQLLLKQKEYADEISQLHGSFSVHLTSYRTLSGQCEANQIKIQELEKLVQDKESLLTRSSFEIKDKDDTINNLKRISEQAVKEKESLESSMVYLQNMAQKLSKDLDDARRFEMERQASLERQIQEMNEYKQKIETQNITIETLESEKKILMNDVGNLSAICTKLVNEYETYVQAASDMEKTMKQNLEESKTVLTQSFEEIKRLTEEMASKEKEIIDLKHQREVLNDKLDAINVTIANNEIQSKLLMESTDIQDKLEKSLSELQEHHEDLMLKACALSEELDITKKELVEVTKQRDEDYSTFKSKLKEIEMKCKNEEDVLKDSLSALNIQYQNLVEMLENERLEKGDLLNAHKDLATKLLKSIHLLIDEKVARQRASSKCYELSQQTTYLVSQKEILENRANDLTAQVARLETANREVIYEKLNVQTLLGNTQGSFNELQRRYNKLEQKLKETRSRLNDLEKQTVVMEAQSQDNHAEYQFTEEEMRQLKIELTESHDIILQLKNEIANLKQEITALEFQKCELSLRLYEMQGKLNTENALNENLRNVQQRFLSTVLQMKEDGAISDSHYSTLLPLVGDIGEP